MPTTSASTSGGCSRTVFHLHVHVIPRYRGDVPNPRGGVRHVIPGRGDYGPHLTAIPEWPDLPHTRALVRGLDDPFLPRTWSATFPAPRRWTSRWPSRCSAESWRIFPTCRTCFSAAVVTLPDGELPRVH